MIDWVLIIPLRHLLIYNHCIANSWYPSCYLLPRLWFELKWIWKRQQMYYHQQNLRFTIQMLCYLFCYVYKPKKIFFSISSLLHSLHCAIKAVKLSNKVQAKSQKKYFRQNLPMEKGLKNFGTIAKYTIRIRVYQMMNFCLMKYCK